MLQIEKWPQIAAIITLFIPELMQHTAPGKTKVAYAYTGKRLHNSATSALTRSITF